jgi:hypothetical protein
MSYAPYEHRVAEAHWLGPERLGEFDMILLKPVI